MFTVLSFLFSIYIRYGKKFFECICLIRLFILCHVPHRCAYFTEDCTTDLGKFLHLYSQYLSGEKKKNEDIVDPLGML